MNAKNVKDTLLTSHPLPNIGRVVVTGNPMTGWTLVEWDGIRNFSWIRAQQGSGLTGTATGRHDGLHAVCRYRRYRVYWSPRRSTVSGISARCAGVGAGPPSVAGTLRTPVRPVG